MSERTKKELIKWLCYILIFFIFFSLQTTPGIFDIKGFKPNIIISLGLFMSLQQSFFDAAVIGAIVGMMLDFSKMGLMGFNGIILMFLFSISTYFYNKYLKRKFKTSFIVLFLVLVVYEFLNFFFFYVIWYENSTKVLFAIFCEFIYTLVFSFFTYFLANKIVKELKLEKMLDENKGNL